MQLRQAPHLKWGDFTQFWQLPHLLSGDDAEAGLLSTGGGRGEEEEEEPSATDGGATGRGTPCCPSWTTGATEASKESCNVAAGFMSFVDKREKRVVGECVYFFNLFGGRLGGLGRRSG